MGTFHYSIGDSKNKRRDIEKLRDNCEFLNEKREKLENQFEKACELLGIAFGAGDYPEAYHTVKKDGDKK